MIGSKLNGIISLADLPEHDLLWRSASYFVKIGFVPDQAGKNFRVVL